MLGNWGGDVGMRLGRKIFQPFQQIYKIGEKPKLFQINYANMLNPNQDPKQKQISISITKIFNWLPSQSSCSFDLNFYPEDSDQPIIEKTVNGVFMSNSMNLNSALKITYTSDENIVILKMMKNRKERKELLGEFQIDLDALREKNVQYFPFGKDYVLQINLYVPMRANSRSSRAGEIAESIQPRGSRINSEARLANLRQPQKEYVYEKKRTPSRLEYNQRSRGYGGEQYEPYPYESRIKKSFSEKVFTLLQQVKSMKQDLIVTGVNRTRKSGRNFQEQFQPDNQNNYQPRIKKSMSDGKFKSYGAIPTPTSPTFRRQQQLKPRKVQKHRLILSTLNVVPCEQYYNKNDTKLSPRPQRQQNCRTSSKNGEVGQVDTNNNNFYSNDYYYESRFN